MQSTDFFFVHINQKQILNETKGGICHTSVGQNLEETLFFLIAIKGVKIPLLTKDNALLVFCCDFTVIMSVGLEKGWGQLEGYRTVAEVAKRFVLASRKGKSSPRTRIQLKR